MSLDKLREVEQAATPGPWKLWATSVMADPLGNSNLDDALLIANTHDDRYPQPRTFNAHFIATARNTYAALLDAASFIDDFLFGCEDPNGELTVANLHELRDRAIGHAARLREVAS